MAEFPRWKRCDDCDVIWKEIAPGTCWVCNGEGRVSYPEVILNQQGYDAVNIDQQLELSLRALRGGEA